MSPHTKKIVFISLGVIAVAAISYYVYMQTIGAPPPLVVSAVTTATPPVATFTFGSASGTTATNGTYSSGTGFTVSNVGNVFTISSASGAIKTVTVTAAGSY